MNAFRAQYQAQIHSQTSSEFETSEVGTDREQKAAPRARKAKGWAPAPTRALDGAPPAPS
jgi:hypothetical protein